MDERKAKQLKTMIPILRILYESDLNFYECYSSIKGLLIAMELKRDFGFTRKKMFKTAEIEFQEEVDEYEKKLKKNNNGRN